MATVIGTVTRATGDTGAVNSPGDQQSNRAAFIARNAQGLAIGSFKSAGQAQQAVNLQVGLVLRWTREDLRGHIEHWVGRTTA
jgi:hypothetical protein